MTLLLTLLLALLAPTETAKSTSAQELRTPVEERLFRSEAVERQIAEIVGQLTNQKLAQMFAACYPNTIDTTVHFEEDEDGTPDTFVYTGDIHAMWLRDSGAQVWPYV